VSNWPAEEEGRLSRNQPSPARLIGQRLQRIGPGQAQPRAPPPGCTPGAPHRRPARSQAIRSSRKPASRLAIAPRIRGQLAPTPCSQGAIRSSVPGYAQARFPAHRLLAAAGDSAARAD
jgi:hypothetical protein